MNSDAEIENIEKAIFINSLENNLSIKAMGTMYTKLIQLRADMYKLLVNKDLNEVRLKKFNDLWFKVTENLINLKIGIREKLGFDTAKEVDEMKSLWESRA